MLRFESRDSQGGFVKTKFCCAVVCVISMLWASFVFGQSSIPQSKVPQFVPPLTRGNGSNPAAHPSKTPPPYCNPCLFYGGDLDLNNPQADTFANETIIPGGFPLTAQIYSPFVVPAGQVWKVTGLFINSLSYPSSTRPARIPWEIRTGIPKAGGSGGIIFAHGKSKVTMTPTGRSINGTPEYTFVVTWKNPILLGPGRYWENVTPQCTSPTDGQCTAQGFTGFLESDMETKGGFNGYGPAEPWDDSFWNAPDFGLTWANVYDVHLQRGIPGGDAFSAGVIGTK